MKKLLSWIFAVCLLLSGCSPFGERLSEPVTFYYVQNDYQYGQKHSVIAGELREAAGHRESLPYLMAMYFLGPVNEDLRSPLPSGTSLLSVKRNRSSLQLELSNTDNISDVDFTLACACLTLTCLDITNAQSVTITSGSRILTMTRENLTLFDNHTGSATEETK